MIEIPKFTIRLEGTQLKKYYLIFVVEFSYQEQKYYYIGNTIDALNINNKRVLNVLSDLLEEANSSTNNHIYRFIAETILGISEKSQNKFDIFTKKRIDNVLANCRIDVHAYPLIELSDAEENKNIHKDNNKQVRTMESAVIGLFANGKKNVINKSKSTESAKYNDILFPKTWERIKKDFYI